MVEHLGGCLCGAVRYRLNGYLDAGYCHCNACRRFTGAPVAAWALARADDLAVEAGELAGYHSRQFCPACGSSLFRRADPLVAVYLGSLDRPDEIEPRIHQCIEHQVAWLRLNDLLPFVEGSELIAEGERHYVRGPAEPSVTRASEVTLRPISRENLSTVVHADVAGNQRRFVAANGISVAQAYAAGDAWQRAVYAGDTVVGFVMAAVLQEDELGLPMAGDPDLWRFMIDSRYQGLGFGRRSLELVLSELRSWDGARNIWLSCVRGTGSPYELYRRYGFEDTGVVTEGEVVMRLRLDESGLP